MFRESGLCEAIDNREILRFTYKRRETVVEPHLLGCDTKGDLILSAWQLSGDGIGWRQFRVSKLRRIASTGDVFRGARSGYDPAPESLDEILCRL